MENLHNRISNSKLPSKREIKIAISTFSRKERIVFSGFCLILVMTTILILENINQMFMTEIPMAGGSISEGIIGTPRFINPILASSDTDRDLASLIYSGLMRKSTDGSITTDLAESYNISKDGSSYTFVLKDKIYFHDGQPVTADDVIFTIKEVKDPIIKSPYKGNWDGVTVEKKDDKTLVFTLKQPYALFLENMTLGIMPAHLWDNTPLELNDANTKPIGSGPYMINAVNKQSSGIIDYYELTPFKKFILGEPYIENINLYFYQNANDLFTDKNIVAAINQAIDKDKIVRDVLLGYGVTIDDPIPPNMIKYNELEDKEPISRKDLLEKAQNNLSKDGWKIGADGFLEKTTTEKKKKVVTKLEFSISTGSVPELVKTAELIKQDLAVIGIKVDIKIFETGNLNQNVIRPRKYDALLFGTIINRESDLFAFWHSSQRKDPGLNVAMYTNAKIDKIISPSDRYLNVHLWYTQTEKVWKIFIKTKNKTNTY